MQIQYIFSPIRCKPWWTNHPFPGLQELCQVRYRLHIPHLWKCLLLIQNPSCPVQHMRCQRLSPCRDSIAKLADEFTDCVVLLNSSRPTKSQSQGQNKDVIAKPLWAVMALTICLDIGWWIWQAAMVGHTSWWRVYFITATRTRWMWDISFCTSMRWYNRLESSCLKYDYLTDFLYLSGQFCSWYAFRHIEF